MTRSEKRVCDAIVELCNVDGYLPATDEIKKASRYSKPSTVIRTLEKLKAQGREKQYGDSWFTAP